MALTNLHETLPTAYFEILRTTPSKTFEAAECLRHIKERQHSTTPTASIEMLEQRMEFNIKTWGGRFVLTIPRTEICKLPSLL